MGLRADCLSAARKERVAERVNKQAKIDETARAALNWLEDNFDFESVDFVECRKDIHYVKRYHSSGGEFWIPDPLTRYRFNIDDISIGINTNVAWAGFSIGCVYAPCLHCQTERPWRFAADLNIRRFVAPNITNGDPAVNTEDFVLVAGRALSDTRLCDHCKAQPCPTCNRPL